MGSLQYKNGIKILKNAIEKEITVGKSGNELGFGVNYVHEVKRRLNNLLDNDHVTQEEYDYYFELVREYEDQSKNRGTISKRVDLTVENDFDERSTYEVERDENSGKITKYKYIIFIRDSDTLIGELTRDQIETIYANYPYVTQNTCSSYFPYLTFDRFKKILRTFRITKDQLHPQHILEEKSDEECAEIALKNKQNAANKKFVEKRGAFAEKSVVELQRELFKIQEDREWADRVVEKYVNRDKHEILIKKDFVQPINIELDQVAYCLFSDIHYGKKYAKAVFGRGYNKEIAHERMMSIAHQSVDYCKKNKIKKLNIAFLGDLLESAILEGMHHGHFMEMDIHGDEQLFFAVDSIGEALRYIYNEIGSVCAIEFMAIGGNHDRLGKERNEDKGRTGSKIAFKILEREFRGLIKVTIPDSTLIVHNESICLIGFHGDNGLAKRKPHELINMHGLGPSGYHLVLSGHYHRGKIEAGTNYLNMSLPSVCSTDKFISEDLGLNNLPAFILGRRHKEMAAFDFEFKNLY